MLLSNEIRIDEGELRSWIGREAVSTDVLSSDLVGKFRATLDMKGEEPAIGDVAPRLIHFCICQKPESTCLLGEDGHPARGSFLPPVPLPQRMWAGGSLTFHAELHVGDTVRRVSRISDVAVKSGRSGLLCFVTVEHVLDVAGKTAITERQDIVYREATLRRRAEERAASTDLATYSKRVIPSSSLLFRYSAITFNSHRIHYDHPYATGVEQYPGLVVHGPLQATLLIDYATEIHGTPPAVFDFRSQSPVFAENELILSAQQSAAGLKLWTSGRDSHAAMVAHAEWT